MGFVRSLTKSAVRTASVFGFLYLAYEMSRSLFLTGLDFIKANFSKDDETENEDSQNEDSEESETEE